MDEEMILEFPQKLIEHHLAFSNGRKLALKNWETSFQRAWGNLFCGQEFTKRRTGNRGIGGGVDSTNIFSNLDKSIYVI